MRKLLSKILDAILGILEKLFPLTMQYIYKLYLYYWLKSCGCIMAEDMASAKKALLEASSHDDT